MEVLFYLLAIIVAILATVVGGWWILCVLQDEFRKARRRKEINNRSLVSMSREEYLRLYREAEKIEGTSIQKKQRMEAFISSIQGSWFREKAVITNVGECHIYAMAEGNLNLEIYVAGQLSKNELLKLNAGDVITVNIPRDPYRLDEPKPELFSIG